MRLTNYKNLETGIYSKINLDSLRIAFLQQNLMQLNSISDAGIQAKHGFESIELPVQPYGISDFTAVAKSASNAFKEKIKWFPYFDICNSLFVPSQIDVIHRAKSFAALVVLNEFVIILGEAFSNPCEIVYTHILPIVNKQIVMHEAYRAKSVNEFILCLHQVARLSSTIVNK